MCLQLQQEWILSSLRAETPSHSVRGPALKSQEYINTKFSGAIFFSNEEMDIMFMMWFLVKQGPGFRWAYVCRMIRFFWCI